jgi:hypothetical protein
MWAESQKNWAVTMAEAWDREGFENYGPKCYWCWRCGYGELGDWDTFIGPLKPQEPYVPGPNDPEPVTFSNYSMYGSAVVLPTTAVKLIG